MVPFLLLLLLPESLADQVCLNISNGDISIITTHANITEAGSDNVKCTMEGYPCFSQCTFSNNQWLNGSSICLEADVETHPTKVVYNMKLNRTCTFYWCKEITILQLLHSLNSKSSEQEEMMQLHFMRDSCAELFNSNHNVKTTFINVERQIIHSIMEASLLVAGDSVNYNLKALSLSMINVSEANLTATGSNPRIQIAAPQLLPQNESFVPDSWLPVYELQAMPQEKRIIALVSYMQHSQFQFEEEDISSMVLRIELLGGQHLQNLNTTIQMTFRILPHTNMDNHSRLQCCYFDENDWHWKTDGCETSNKAINNHTEVTCQCNHATPFAVLLMRDPIAEVHWKILSYISYIGSSLSAFFTALSLVIYVYSRKQKMDYSMSIHVSLSGALFLLNSAFLLTEWGATAKPDWVCVLLASLLHYFLLCSFTWMAIEALHLYLLLIKVFNTQYKHYMVKLSLAGWGIPGVIVAVTLGLKDIKQFYGVTHLSMADTNQTMAICWITDDSFFYSMNLVYFTVTFIFNSGILLAVAFSICKLKQVSRSSTVQHGDPARFSESCRSCLTVFGLSCLMGSTWGLAFLGSGYVNYPILYLFCILNSTQGFLIFLWICLSAKKQRMRHMEDRTTSAAKTSGNKAD